MSDRADKLRTLCGHQKVRTDNPPITPRCPQSTGQARTTCGQRQGPRDFPALGGASLVPSETLRNPPSPGNMCAGQPSGLHFQGPGLDLPDGRGKVSLASLASAMQPNPRGCMVCNGR